ncbi:hypothetical protein RB596_008251 [Gaeumannomyces avenae]
MSPTADFEQEAGAGRRLYSKPHSGRRPIPTIHGYREHRKELEGQLNETEEAQHEPEDDSKPKRAFNSVKAIFKEEEGPKSGHDPFPSVNRNLEDRERRDADDSGFSSSDSEGQESRDTEGRKDDQGHGRSKKKSKDDENKQQKSATEAAASAIDPREKRKAMKKTKRTGGGREVTDPVTHLPIIIHDHTDKDLQSAEQNLPEPGTDHRTARGLRGATKSDEELDAEQKELQQSYNGMVKMFPPPDFDELRRELENVYQQALIAGLVITATLTATVVSFLCKGPVEGPKSIIGTLYGYLSNTAFVSICCAIVAAGIMGVGTWVRNKVAALFDDETWDAARRGEAEVVGSDAELPESTQWLNSLFSNIWPLINPDLFVSMIDMIEDVMQASLPRVIKMVSVEDMGQGSESFRVLGIRWLPTGAASQTVTPEGQLERPEKNSSKDSKDALNSGGGGDESQNAPRRSGDESDCENDDMAAQLTQQEQQDQAAMKQGLEGEEGDFVNLGLALAYRSRSSGKSIKSKAKNAHLYIKFYLPGGLAVPVWVELKGFIATLRVRLQLTPDPPFISLCTLTFLGQPRVSLSCVPLSKHSLNIMDVPLISSFVQSSVDAAVAEYVAPKSLTLNLKDMLVGDDFKKDTFSRGVIWIFIKQARGFKQGDSGLGPFKEASSDSYVTVSWGKFGKPVSSTRIVMNEQQPDWHEYASILVTPEELNADEKLRLQLWDSDRWTADDDLGRVEIDLKYLMSCEDTRNRMQDREDQFRGQDSSEMLPGTLTWSVGYFTKPRIGEEKLAKQTVNPEITTKEQLKEHVSKLTERKLRESGAGPHDDVVHQQKAQDYKEIEDSMIISAPPSEEHLSGILSIQIHNITGLEVQRLNRRDREAMKDYAEESEQEDDMPDSYCTIILNHKKIYKTRTKPKNSKPFFNAGTERFIKDWRTAEVMIAVRDSREREDDPLIGLVFLPLAKIFAKRSQIHEDFPLVGGIGYGRARVSLVWRSVEMNLEPNLTGWDYGTLEVCGPVREASKDSLPSDLRQHRIKLRTNMGKLKMQPRGKRSKDKGNADTDSEGRQEWCPREKRVRENAFLPVRRRYASALVIEFRESAFGPDRTPAFAVIWLHELTDEEERTFKLKVWKGGKNNLRRAESCCDYDGMHDGEEELGEVELTLKFWRGLSGYHKSYASQSKNADMRNVMECLDTITDEGLRDDEGDETDDTEPDSEDEDGGKEGDDQDAPVDGGEIETDEKGEREEANKETTDTNDSKADKEAAAAKRKRLQVHTNDSSSGSDSDSDKDGDEDDTFGKGGDDDGSDSRETSPLKRLSRFKKIKSIFRSPVDGGTKAVLSVATAGHDGGGGGDGGVRGRLKDYKDHHKQLHRKHRGVMQWRAARQADHVGGKLSRLKGTVGGMFKHKEKDVGIETEV